MAPGEVGNAELAIKAERPLVSLACGLAVHDQDRERAREPFGRLSEGAGCAGCRRGGGDARGAVERNQDHRVRPDDLEGFRVGWPDVDKRHGTEPCAGRLELDGEGAVYGVRPCTARWE